MSEPEQIGALRSEWSNLFKNKFLLVSVIVILFIPIMYGGFFLGSVWDPYNNTENIPVAFVNEDLGATINDEPINIGNDVAETLREDKNFKWDFVSKEAAQQGIEDGSYYMMIEVPSYFSAQASSITDETPEQSVLPYTTTPAKNYVGSLMTANAAEKIAANVSETISKSYAKAILSKIGSLGEGLEKAADGATQLNEGAASLESGVSAYTEGVGKVSSGQEDLSKGLKDLQSGSSKLSSGLNQLGSQLPSNADIKQLDAGISQIQGGLDALNLAVTTPNEDLIAQQTAVSEDASALQKNLIAFKQAATSAGTSPNSLGQAAGVAAAKGETSVSVDTADVLKVLDLVQSSQDVASKSASLLANLNQLTTTLSKQQAELSRSVAQLSGGFNKLAPNLQVALEGYEKIEVASKQLSAGAEKLTGGISAASAGSNQVSTGTKKLAKNSAALLSGTSKITDGTGGLATELTDAATQISAQPVGEKTSTQIASPVAGQETLRGDVPGYGYALAPYVLSLGLFVGALVFNTIYPVRRKFGRPQKAWQWWTAKVSIGAVVAVGQALALDAIMIFGLGLRPDFPKEFIAMSIIAALAFMAIVMFLSISMNNVGRFFAMILLVLQLGASEGTFPLETAPKFFQVLNPYMPMTYSIRGFREAISSGLGSQAFTTNFNVLAVVALIFGAALYTYFVLRGIRSFTHASVDN